MYCGGRSSLSSFSLLCCFPSTLVPSQVRSRCKCTWELKFGCTQCQKIGALPKIQYFFAIIIYIQCGNCCDLVSHIFGKNFVKLTVLLRKLQKSWFNEIFFGETKFFVFLHCAIPTVWKNEKFGLTNKIFRQFSYLVISLVKTLLSRNFCQKCVRLNRSSFHTVHTVHTVEITEIYSHWKNISSNCLFSNFFSKNVTFTKFLPKMCRTKSHL